MPDHARRGFTLVEALIAVSILITGLAAMAGVSVTMTRKARTPDDAGKAAWLATERVNYFRAQGGFKANGDSHGSVSGFVAAGGSYFPPPVDPRQVSKDRNRIAEYHNVAFNRRPTLLVREYLYDTADVARAALGDDVTAEAARRRDFVRGQRFAINEIPTTPAIVKLDGAAPFTVVRVVPNPESEKDPPDPEILTDDGTFVAIPAPRANDDLRGPSFGMTNRALRFVREVWVQPMHPLFPAGPAGAVAAGAPAFLPTPPYGVAITVRVYLKDPKVVRYTAGTPLNPTEGKGPDPKRLLAEMVGVVGIQ